MLLILSLFLLLILLFSLVTIFPSGIFEFFSLILVSFPTVFLYWSTIGLRQYHFWDLNSGTLWTKNVCMMMEDERKFVHFFLLYQIWLIRLIRTAIAISFYLLCLRSMIWRFVPNRIRHQLRLDSIITLDIYISADASRSIDCNKQHQQQQRNTFFVCI